MELNKDKKLAIACLTVFLCGLFLGSICLAIGNAFNDWKGIFAGWFLIIAGIISAIGTGIYYTHFKEPSETEQKKQKK